MSNDFSIGDALAEDFDPQAEYAGGTFDLLPPDDYQMQIDEWSIMTGANGWKGLKLQLTIIAGDFANRKFFDSITLAHDSSAPAREMGAAKLKSLYHSAGLADIFAAGRSAMKGDELIGRVVEAKIIQKKRKGTTDAAKAAISQYGDTENAINMYTVPNVDGKTAASPKPQARALPPPGRPAPAPASRPAPPAAKPVSRPAPAPLKKEDW